MLNYKKVVQVTFENWIGKTVKINSKHDDKPYHGKANIILHAYIYTIKKEPDRLV